MKRRSFLIGSGISIATQASAIASGLQNGSQITIGDSQLRVLIAYGPEGVKEEQYETGQLKLASLSGTPWTLEFEDGILSPVGSRATLIDRDARSLPSWAVFAGGTDGVVWQLKYEVTGNGRITKSLQLTSSRNRKLLRAILWKAEGPHDARVARTKLQDIVVFYRQSSAGLFVSLDFPYSNIVSNSGVTTNSYPPHDLLTTGHSYHCHSLTLGAVRLTGEERYGVDTGEVAAMDAYIQEHRPPRFHRPMLVYSSIINRYTQVDGDVVFYTMHDQPALSFNTELVERDLDLMAKLGMEYYQVFPGAFEWAPGDPKSEVARLVRRGRDLSLRVGDYSGTSYVYSPHFNVYRNSLKHPEWLIHDSDGRQSKVYCFGCKAFADLYVDTVVDNCRRYGFELHCLDLLKFSPCYATNHFHPAGIESYYHQIRGLMRVIEAINAVSPQMMTWPNSGDFLELLPKLGWYSPNLYLTDPFIRTPLQGLNMTRLLDDVRREQMVSLHHSVFLPYRFFSNVQYFFSQNSIVPDMRNFEYGFLSTIAVTPNIGFGEIRPWLDRMSAPDRDRICGFYQRWTRLLRENFHLWTKTHVGGESPGMGGVEIYSHADRDHGFLFLVNPNYWNRTVTVPLDSSMGFDFVGRCEIAELYPAKRLRLTAEGPWPEFGTRLPIEVPAQQVIVLEVGRAPREISSSRLYGLAGTLESIDQGYRLKTSGPQGRTERFAILLPKGSEPLSTAVVLDLPKLPDPRLSAPTPLTLLSTSESGALLEITFRRDAAPTELRKWRAMAGDRAQGIAGKWPEGLPVAGETLRFPVFVDTDVDTPIDDETADRLKLGPLANFCGAYIDNAFSEMQETWIELRSGDNTGRIESHMTSGEEKPVRTALAPRARTAEHAWWFEMSFNLPFMYTIGAEPPWDQHAILVFPLLRHRNVRRLEAWIDGKELNVQRYTYPRNRSLACYYADLVGSSAHKGNNTLVVHLDS